MKKEITINIDENLYLASKDKLNMTLNEFIEYSLIVYTNPSHDEYSRLFKKGAKLFKEFNIIREKLYNLESSSKDDNNEEAYAHAMVVVDRIHGELGYIGKNQLKKIANQNDISGNTFIKYVESLDGYTVSNFSALPK